MSEKEILTLRKQRDAAEAEVERLRKQIKHESKPGEFFTCPEEERADAADARVEVLERALRDLWKLADEAKKNADTALTRPVPRPVRGEGEGVK